MAGEFTPRAWVAVPVASSATAVAEPPAPPSSRAVTAMPSFGVSSKGRQSRDDPTLPLFAGLSYLIPFSQDDRWRNLLRDSRSLDCIPTADLLELLAEVSPDVSRALWDLLRLCNPGHTTRALTVGADPKVHDAGQLFLDDFEGQLGELYGSFNVIVNRLFTDAFLRGAFVAELVLDAAGRLPVDLATPDGRWIYFQIVLDELRGPVWQPFQWIYGEKVVLDRKTFRYVPVDPLPGKPIGRAMCSPAIFTALFLLGMLHDLKRVVQQQGYPRIDISISLEELSKSMPPDLIGDTEKVREWLTNAVNDVGTAYSRLEPDDAYIHTDTSTVNRPVGAIDSSSLGAVDGLLRALDSQIFRALKTLPLLMGSNESVTETHANRQWELHLAGIRSLQQLAEGLMEHMYNLALRAAGIPAVSEFRFDELRNAELLRDAQVQMLQTQVAALRYDLGFDSQDEACQLATGKDKADQPEPRIPGAGTSGGQVAKPPSGGTAPAAVQPDPGSTKATHTQYRSAIIEELERELAQARNGKHRED